MQQAISTVHETLQAARGRAIQVGANQPAPARVRFTIAVAGAGESRLMGDQALDFGTYLLDEPSFSFGMVATGPIATGHLPVGGATVLNWLVNEQGMYTGAEIGFKVESLNRGIGVKFSLTFEGSALRATVGQDGGLGIESDRPNFYEGV